MRLLVTGSSGQLGSYVCEIMSDHVDVVGMDVRPPRVENITHVGGDVRSRLDVRNALSGVDAVVHCAAQVSVERSIEDPFTDAERNENGTINLLHESADAGVERFVYISSAAVLGDPQYLPVDESHPTEPMSNYGVSKLAGERFSIAYSHTRDLRTVVIRPFNFYSSRADPKSPYSGVITKFISRVTEGKPPVIEGDGLQTRDFIHAMDVARFVSAALNSRENLSGQVFNCGSGEQTSVLELARLVISLSGKDLEPEFAAPRKGDIRASVADMGRSRSALDFTAEISLRDGLSEMLG